MKLLFRLREFAKMIIKRPPEKIEHILPKLIIPEVRSSSEEQESHPG